MNRTGEQAMPDAAAFRSACSLGECVEVAITEVVAVRDSKDAPDGPVLWFSHTEWREFVAAVKAGKFDLG
jgi:hypothetical protein